MNSRANWTSRRSLASPSFQSLLLLAMTFLQVLLPKALRRSNILPLRPLVAADEQQDYLRPDRAEIKAVPRSKIEASLLDAASGRVMVSEIPAFESEYPSLDPRTCFRVQSIEPPPVGRLPGLRQKLQDRKRSTGLHRATSL